MAEGFSCVTLLTLFMNGPFHKMMVRDLLEKFIANWKQKCEFMYFLVSFCMYEGHIIDN